RDLISRWDVLEVLERATTSTAAEFLATLRHRMPFLVRAIQVDGSSEFYVAFEDACRRAGVRRFVLPPKSSKLNSAVERAQRTHTEEFYEVHDVAWKLAAINRQVRSWERVRLTVPRPTNALAVPPRARHAGCRRTPAVSYVLNHDTLLTWAAGGR